MLKSTVFTLVVALLCFVSVSAYGDWTGDPSHVKITIYGVAVSSHVDCSNAIGFNYAGGKEIDFVEGDTIFSQNLSDGTYPCVMLKMSDKIKVTPATTSGDNICQAGVESEQVICSPANSGTYTPITINSDNSVTFGSNTACTGDDIVTLFLSTASSHSGNNVPYAFNRPISSNSANCDGDELECGVNIANAFVVSGTTTGTFVVNFSGAVDVQDGECAVEAPIFNFR